MNLPPEKICRRICQLFALVGSSVAGEAENARDKLNKLLATNGLSWNDLPAILAAAAPPSAAGPPPPSDPPQVNVLDLILRLLELHLSLTQAQRMATALWALHTHIFDRYAITPRLALLSPVRGCGKTTALILLEALSANPDRSDHVTPAAIYHTLYYGKHTLLLDEGDNLGLLHNDVLRTVLNGGHRRGGKIGRIIGGRLRKFSLFAPLAVAAIGLIPLPLMHRSVVINMQRHPPTAAPLQRLDENDPALAASRSEIQRWAATCALNPDPEIPPELHGRAADNWRPLLAIADDLGHGVAARAAAITLNSGRLDEDPGAVLLGDIRSVFDTLGVDRLTSAALIEALLGLEDSLWHEWRGPRDDRPARKLSQSELSRLLRPFVIRPRTIRHHADTKTARGYLRSQFEAAWQAYCPTPDTPTQSSRIIHLLRY